MLYLLLGAALTPNLAHAQAEVYPYATSEEAMAACQSNLAYLQATLPSQDKITVPCVDNYPTQMLIILEAQGYGEAAFGYATVSPQSGHPNKTMGPPCPCAGDPINLATGNEY
ncbi:hypothetical protein, partial [Dyella sp. S184]|uniref:hypothetical protein n=1 Tax=Dyella sp. S184 TaxID=1641862 RepID=UPI001C204D16